MYKPITKDEIIVMILMSSFAVLYRILDDFCADSIHDDTPLSKIINLSVPKMTWLTDWLLSFGSRLEILSPDSIKKQLKEEVEKMAAKF